jgi:hypothetical protein
MKQDGDHQLIGTYSNGRAVLSIHGRVEKDSVRFTIDDSREPNGRITFEARLVSSDSLSGTVNFDDVRKVPFAGRRISR